MAQIDFSRRNNLSELMDSDETDFETFRDCLVDLTKVNRLTLAYRPTIRFFKKLARSGRVPRDRTITIVDVGSGYGDTLRKIDRWASEHGFKFDLTGIDLNPWSARAARAATSPDRPIHYVTANVFAYQPTKLIDIVISSLLTHHLDDAALVRFIRWMEANTIIGWFINDAHRKALPYHLFRVSTRVLGFHTFVQHDGPISIARSFRTADWQRLLAAGDVGVPPARIERVFPYRLCVSRFRE
jgi:SAM-dependent methyltransferase